MERNVYFEIEGLTDIAVRLAWAQMEVFADDVEKIQVLAAGDEGSVNDLRILIRDNTLIVEQPQYGLSLNLMESRWMQACVRVPKTWRQGIHLNTISGLLSARGLFGGSIVLDSISGDIHATRITAEDMTFKTISGDMRAEKLTAGSLSARSVSGTHMMEDVEVNTLRCNSVSGEQTYHLSKAFSQIDVGAVAGNVTITAPIREVNLSMRSISGRGRTEGLETTENPNAPKVRVTGVSADVTLMSVQK